MLAIDAYPRELRTCSHNCTRDKSVLYCEPGAESRTFVAKGGEESVHGRKLSTGNQRIASSLLVTIISAFRQAVEIDTSQGPQLLTF